MLGPTLLTALLTFTPLALGAAVPHTSSTSARDPRLLSFIGTGQLRLFESGEASGRDVGCLTDAGLWTRNEPLCATFTGAAAHDVRGQNFTLTTAAGKCYIASAGRDYGIFGCGGAEQPEDSARFVFGEIAVNSPQAVPAGDYLSWTSSSNNAQNFIFATWVPPNDPQSYPWLPSAEDAPLPLHFFELNPEESAYVLVYWKSTE